ncbi:ATP-binding sensor histidine kinase [Alkalinema sp. FACHB-956]|uniref:trifunctional serine/threonine-protein kinase/ATP-binding protein/sensor histidine kinase n=1 Tax=Alkalinema sp. FACHB-956 TaxID=2692768 RepID=UPI001681EFAD|nr:ATP-binding sensor histidine kinase [Alkalinema sp. FACHB-956]MBD2325813.1 AAA family ATPase [Alkalinema sp. FACHB-956]
MLELAGYKFLETLYEGSRTVIHRCLRIADQQTVVIKFLRHEYPSFNELVQFRNQYSIAQELNAPGIIHTYSLEAYKNAYGLVMEDFGGVSLTQWLQESQPCLVALLPVAIWLCDTLQVLYQNRIIHKDIKPANILIHPDTQQVKLIDFSISSRLPRETQEILNPNILEGTLAYLSPEQTGRMNRGIDYRSDFYSFGITLYEILTGQPPFPTDDPMELIHCHLASQPTPVHTVNPAIPEALSNVVSKLMAKNAEDRYQSPLGIKHDLATCLHQLKETGTIAVFPLGTQDVSDRFTIPEKLYGRQEEVKTLLAAFERVAQGATELVLVAGFSGIGKTAVVNEVHKPMAQGARSTTVKQQGYFIKGKFDQFNRNIPFSAFVQAFRDLVAQLLSESDTQLHTWKTRILDALGDNAQVIVDLIPELDRILGPQPPAPELSGTAAQNRFNLLFQRFIQVFTTAEHPLVVFIDDLQWADSASLNLMQVLMAEAKTGYLLILGAYRDNEVFAAHPLMLTLESIAKVGTPIETITLQPLNDQSLNQLVAETLHAAASVAQPLTELVMQKTQGNPFFATQFLRVLHQDQLITFDRASGHWQCEIGQVRDAALTDDVVELMARQLQKLPESTQNVLKFAACIGAQFDLETLAIVAEQSQTDVANTLWQALQEGLIIPTTQVYQFFQSVDREKFDQQTPQTTVNPAYRFLHDRVQQAAYSLIATDQKQITHLKMGQTLLWEASPQEREERLFTIVNHLNLGSTFITSPQERETLADLNLAAGRKAKTATAYQAAIAYFEHGIQLLPTDSWQTHYDLSLALHEEITEANYLTSNFVELERWATLVCQQAKTLLDTIKVQQHRILGASVQGRLLESLQIGLELLRTLGLEFPAQPTPADIGQALSATRALWAEREIHDFLELPSLTDPHLLAQLQVISGLSASAYVVAPTLMPLLICKQLEISLQFGNCPISVFTYSDYGVILCGVVGDIENGYAFGELALALRDRLHLKNSYSRSGFINYYFIKHWKDALSTVVPALERAYQDGIETGDLEAANLNAGTYCAYAYFQGHVLSDLLPKMEAYRQVTLKHEHLHSLLLEITYQQATLNLLGHNQHPAILSGELFDAETHLPALKVNSNFTGLFHWYVNQAILYYLFNEYQQAARISQEAREYLHGGTATFTVVLYVWFDALIQLRCYPNAGSEEQPTILQQVQQQQDQLRHWATFAPTNHHHRGELVAAEYYRVLGDIREAIDYYDRAIASAKENGFIQDEALANELAAQFYLDWGKDKVAAGYIQEAYYCYTRWGAQAKVADLESRYPHLLHPILQQADPSAGLFNTLLTLSPATVTVHSNHRTSSSSASINYPLDFAAILKASQALSSTIQLDELLHQLSQIILQNSGADRCALLLPNDTGDWQVRAIATVNQTQLCTEDLTDHPLLPVKLIQYVKNTQELVVIDDLETDLPVIGDYLRQHQPKSVLGLPMFNQGHFIGILFLENQSTSGAFPPDRVLVLNFLCTQAAISLENARLYQQAQHYAQQLEQTQLQIVQSEKMASLGNLVAGVAHEINNPIGFLSGSITNEKDYLKDLLAHLDLYQAHYPHPHPAIQGHAEDIDLDFLRQDFVKLINSMHGATDRIKSISTSLRTFSRADMEHTVSANLHEGIDSTILILKYRLKANEHRPEIEVLQNYGDLPEIQCFPGQLNQVFMNILANAIDMFDEMAQETTYDNLIANPQQITIQTAIKGGNIVEIQMRDNGKGMGEAVKAKIFDHLFTTKGVGKGTGLGLAIARQIVEETHGGDLAVQSTLGQGTTFTITLPIKAKN